VSVPVVLIGAGYVLGTQWERVADTRGPLATPALVLTVIAAGRAGSVAL